MFKNQPKRSVVCYWLKEITQREWIYFRIKKQKTLPLKINGGGKIDTWMNIL